MSTTEPRLDDLLSISAAYAALGSSVQDQLARLATAAKADAETLEDALCACNPNALRMISEYLRGTYRGPFSDCAEAKALANDIDTWLRGGSLQEES